VYVVKESIDTDVLFGPDTFEACRAQAAALAVTLGTLQVFDADDNAVHITTNPLSMPHAVAIARDGAPF
jgi:hypothetical protein